MEENQKRKALIDGDLLAHEIAILGEYYHEDDLEKEKLIIRDFRYLEEIVVNRVSEICAAAGCDDEPVIYLTGKNNFRYDIAVTKPYKSTRDKEKPVHFENVKWFLISRYGAKVIDGMEADDALAIHQTGATVCCPAGGERVWHEELCDTVICTRDKDLLQVPGWHYGWEVGLQPERRLHFVDELGELNATYSEGVSAKTGKPTKSFKKLSGTGYLWFCAQALVGDPTDTIPGLKGYGPKISYELLSKSETKTDALNVLKDEYKKVYGDSFKEMLVEQARLVWMVRELNEDGSPKMWSIDDV